MNIDEFRVRGKEMVEYICEYIRTLEGKRVTANVDPGYLRPLLPREAPAKPEPWEAIMRDVDGKIMSGVSVSRKLAYRLPVPFTLIIFSVWRKTLRLEK
ncbi:hypothetical protein KM043_018514 [Ampulex compressa]|nr:hypothetical protein KM043_018514 [Ampulex compressa]